MTDAPDPATAALIDFDRTTCLCDAGQPDYLAATAVSEDGSTHLLLAELDSIGDLTVTYDSTCPHAGHEQTGPLPLDVVRRITAATRRARGITPRCGRPTRAGTPWRISVSRPGDACGWHR